MKDPIDNLILKWKASTLTNSLCLSFYKCFYIFAKYIYIYIYIYDRIKHLKVEIKWKLKVLFFGNRKKSLSILTMTNGDSRLTYLIGRSRRSSKQSAKRERGVFHYRASAAKHIADNFQRDVCVCVSREHFSDYRRGK